MAYYMTEAQVRAERIRWNLDQLDPEGVETAKREARELAALQIVDDEGDGHIFTYEEWLDTIAQQLRLAQDRWRGMCCGEMGDQ